MDKLIVVAGRPSGGTSMLAGVLYHLGVDMGQCPTVEQLREVGSVRNYRGFECMMLKEAYGNLPATASCEQRMDAVRWYIRQRFAMTDGPVGVKLNSLLYLAGCQGLEELPLVVAAVERDLEATFASDIKYRGTEDWDRAVERGLLDLAFREFVRRVPPAVTVQYEDALWMPMWTAARVQSALGLTSTLEQLERAAASIHPTRCKWEQLHEEAGGGDALGVAVHLE